MLGHILGGRPMANADAVVPPTIIRIASPKIIIPLQYVLSNPLHELVFGSSVRSHQWKWKIQLSPLDNLPHTK